MELNYLQLLPITVEYHELCALLSMMQLDGRTVSKLVSGF
uniref:Uncharacterized protein n=1 Tax=Arundo donax TaxID=35708 RepID=A0A0A9C0J1_ARUDO